MEEDFLRVGSTDYDSLDTFSDYIRKEIDLENISGNLNIIGTVSDFHSKQALINSLEKSFDILTDNGNIFLLETHQGQEPYYMLYDKDFPVFFTTARKTEGPRSTGNITNTLFNHIKWEKNLGRMWVSQAHMEDIRMDIVEQYKNIMIPQFSAKRNKHVNIDAKRRPDYDRSIQYSADDGLETYKEMKRQYGVLPTMMKFQRPNQFKFKVSTDGVFTINKGGLNESVRLIRETIDRLRDIKSAIDTSDYEVKNNKYSKDSSIPQSKPWAINLKTKLKHRDVNNFREAIQNEYWGFTVSKLDKKLGSKPHLSATLVDSSNYGRVAIKSKDNTLRIYPREDSGIDEALRIYEYVTDQIDPRANAIAVR
ncbi:hypothetical protein [Candidatus Nanohalobium constans]|uniref:Uncharacterized protein n=1 Tax=Candidatus Nanohalobium constans TaxID=2565781 RepID=A0A5Q0UIV7_9ARCH|nr:hypothetical protein [Candidatus Nanohalobium constans]QGA80885.1 hypothetical protein LC1Nh_1009 [Candidatus Nanohalobium constans]